MLLNYELKSLFLFYCSSQSFVRDHYQWIEKLKFTRRKRTRIFCFCISRLVYDYHYSITHICGLVFQFYMPFNCDWLLLQYSPKRFFDSTVVVVSSTALQHFHFNTRVAREFWLRVRSFEFKLIQACPIPRETANLSNYVKPRM